MRAAFVRVNANAGRRRVIRRPKSNHRHHDPPRKRQRRTSCSAPDNARRAAAKADPRQRDQAVQKHSASDAERELLSSPGMSVKELARAAGFRDPLCFTRVLRQATGLPPREYARR
ncbi:MAG: helix-turn-helix domain-containing protein [Kiritimatiellae bacterium]|nr:helix-turn-helix domain-containing protein [Kiritimatiellia bacterium]